MLQQEGDRSKRLNREPGLAIDTTEARKSSLIGRFLARLRSIVRPVVEPWRRKRASHCRRQAELRLLRQSELFDPSWYLETYPDVASARIDPAVHYLDSGWREGRNPSARFGTTHYLRRYLDVAALGINPLIHFIEHGRFEGRELESVGERPSPRRNRGGPRTSLPLAMPVFVAEHTIKRPVPWLRACNLAGAQNSVELDGLGLATIAEPRDRLVFDAIISDFVALSSGESTSLDPPFLGQFPAATDFWFATSHRLMSRWNLAEPTVIRALQLDAVTGRLVLVGEGLALGPLDPIECDLISPTMPILLLSASCDAELHGLRRLAFPSLARGGIHYPELIDASADQSAFDLMALSAKLEADLRKLRAGAVKPIVRDLAVDMAGAKSSEPIFQRDLRYLLERILLIDVVPTGAAAPANAGAYLTGAVQLAAKQGLRSDGSTLVIAADMIPALRMLVAIDPEENEESRDLDLGLLVCDPDPAQPAVRFDLPAVEACDLQFRSDYYPLPFPRMRSAARWRAPAAIRSIQRSLDDAELLYPDLAAFPDPRVASSPVSWLVDWGEGDEELLAQSLTALSLQQGIGLQRLCFLRPPSKLVREIAHESFGDRWKFFVDIDEAMAASDNELIGYLGRGIIIHDSRTIALLATLLLDQAVSSSSCALVASSRQGNNWHPVLVDGGHIPIDLKVVFGGRVKSPAEMLWRACYPVAEPASHLWIAKSDEVRGRRTGNLTDDRLHLFTSRVTASFEGGGRGDPGQSSEFIRSAMDDRCIRARVLVG